MANTTIKNFINLSFILSRADLSYSIRATFVTSSNGTLTASSKNTAALTALKTSPLLICLKISITNEKMNASNA